MNRTTFDAMLAQYKKQDVSGEGAVSWDKGARCVIPEVLIGGKAVQDGTPTPDTPVMPVFSEGAEVVCRGKNLWENTLNLEQGILWHEDTQTYEIGVRAYATSMPVHEFKNPIPAGTKLTIIVYVESGYLEENGVELGGYHNSDNGTSWQCHVKIPKNTRFYGDQYTQTYTTTKPVTHFVLFLNHETYVIEPLRFRVMFVIGEYQGDWKPCFDGGTAVAPELLAIPGTDIRDEWNPQTGMGVRRVGKLVLDGTEDWTDSGYSTASFNAFYPRDFQLPAVPNTRPHPCMCTHLPMKPNYLLDELGVVCSIYNRQIYIFLPKEDFPDVAAVEEWLAEQYAAGTPVTIWYALLEPVPFETDPAPLIQPPGTGHIIQTSGTLDGVPITVTPVTHL